MAGYQSGRRLPTEEVEGVTWSKATSRFPRQTSRRIAATIIVALGLMASRHGFANESLEPIPIAVIDFNYRDTSGEAHDSTAEHQARLKAFMDSIRTDVASSEKYRLVDVSCGTKPCSISDSPPSELLEEAKRAGARLLLYGGIHKMSTLVQWAKVQVVDIEADKLVLDRLLSFRGDSDEAWRRAEAFIVEKLRDELPPK